MYCDRVDVSYRWSMSWFIFSEVMFFGAFFGALYWARAFALPMLGDIDHAAAVARLQGRVAERRGGLHGLAGRHGRAVHHHGPVADPDA